MEVLKMKYPTRIYYTEADKSLMRDRWERGARGMREKELKRVFCDTLFSRDLAVGFEDRG